VSSSRSYWCALLLWNAVTWKVAQAQVDNPGTITCPSDSTITGYGTIGALNADMKKERDRIAAGGAAKTTPYVFNLCPKTEFNMQAEPLTPLLDNVSIICGKSGAPSDDCVLRGGDTQVVVDDSTVPSYPITAVSLIGLTFSDFSEAAVAGGASDITQVTLLNVVFTVSKEMHYAWCR
jgi:hypothetical protein